MSQPLLDNLPFLADRIQSAGHLLIALDYDGTLTPIVRNPAQAVLCPSVRTVLHQLHQRPATTVAIVSGRQLGDVQALVGIDSLLYAGNHGLEIVGPDFYFLHSDAQQATTLLQALASQLEQQLADLPGVFVENKRLTLAVHTRQAVPSDKDIARDRVERVCRGLAQQQLRLVQGKEVLEIRPGIDWHKGRAIAWIADRLRQPNLLTVFVGDDRTDEDAFRFLPDALTVKVGSPLDTAASYHVADPTGVVRFLNWLVSHDKEGSGS
jgi:trehalose 6-phosphate phosphatase